MFPNGQLRKFGISDSELVESAGCISIDKLIGLMAKFKIENVVFENVRLKEKPSESFGDGITSFHLDDDFGLSYEFLKRLPNLRFLSVHVPVQLWNYLETPTKYDDDDTFTSKVRRYFWNADPDCKLRGAGTFNIWNMCEKLEILSVTMICGYKVCGLQFLRESGNKPYWGLSTDTEEDKEDSEDDDMDEEESEDDDGNEEESEDDDGNEEELEDDDKDEAKSENDDGDEEESEDDDEDEEDSDESSNEVDEYLVEDVRDKFDEEDDD